MWYGHMTSWPNVSMFLLALSLLAILGVFAWALAWRPDETPAADWILAPGTADLCL
jgi:hypothetical protein